MNTFQPLNFIQAELQQEDWGRIIRALEFYIITTEEQLREIDASDSPWEDLEDFKGLRNDLLTYVLSKGNL